MANKANYQQINHVKSLIEEKRQLEYDIHRNESNQQKLTDLLSYLTSGNQEIDDFKEMKKNLNQEIGRLTSLVNLFNAFPNLKNKEEIMNKMNELVAEKQSIKSVTEYEAEIEESLKLYGICRQCHGKTTVYDRESAGNDPYARSSDYQKACPTCKGTGKYVEQQTKL